MNSEELELSLRTEFESHLRDVFAGMRQEFSQFQEQINVEFEKHKSLLDTVFQEFSARLEASQELDQGFKESVVEHLRLARDEGARLTATALAEAEEMRQQSMPTEPLPPMPVVQAAPSAGVSELRDAINDITSQDSQGTILKSLVQHAAQFTPRGAFFIIKNEHFVGWRVFNKEGEANEEAVREVYLPVSAQSILGASVRSLSAVESSFGTYLLDTSFLDQIGFGEPEKMIAIPLVARGRGVAVLYADYGSQGEQVNIEALETLVRVAGLTVEILASGGQAAKPVQSEPTPIQESKPVEEPKPQEEAYTPISKPSEPLAQSEAQPAETFSSDYQPNDNYQSGKDYQTVNDYQPNNDYQAANDYQSSDDYQVATQYQPEVTADVQEISVEPAQEAEAQREEEPSKDYSSPAMTDFHYAGNQESVKQEPVNQEPAQETPSEEFVQKSFEKENFSSSFETSNGSMPFTPEPKPVETVTAAPVETVAATPVKSRFNDRNVDLPIEVSEDERRLHNDARRFARLLVSEIKLYNEQKVKEGREAKDLYDRLREAIDRSRDMYDKRVQPPVAAKFDYFHYELVSTLAEGEAQKLGSDYPGAAI